MAVDPISDAKFLWVERSGDDMGELLSIADSGVKKGLELGADEIEIFLLRSEQTEALLENNEIHIGRTDVKSGTGIRVFKEKRLGFASINSIDERDIEKGIERALRLATHAPPEPWNELPDKEPLRAVRGLYDSEIENHGIEDTLKMAEKMLREARERDRRVTVDSGIFSAGKGEVAVVNSRGIEAEEKTSTFLYYLSGMAVDGKEVSNLDYSIDFTHKTGKIDVSKVANEFAGRVISSLGARSVKSFRGPAILGPDAGRLLLGTVLGNAIDSDNVQKQMSRFAGKLEKKVAGDCLTITDDGLEKDGLSTSSFDREGLPHKQTKVIEKGRLRSFLYNTRTAKKEGTVSTGNASGGERHPPGVGVTNFVMDGGGTDFEKIVSETKQGIIVRRLSGFPDSMSGDFSAVVKGGFLVEKGEIVHPVTDTIISGNVFDILKDADVVSKERERILNYTLPYIKTDRVSVTGIW